MKKFLAVVLSVLCALSMAGCADVCAGFMIGIPVYCTGSACAYASAGPHEFYKEITDIDSITIELVELEEGLFYGDERGSEKIKPVKKIEDKTGFMKEFLTLKGTSPFSDPKHYLGRGKAICITYPDGDIELIGERASALVSDKVRTHDFNFLDDSFEAFWDKWAQQTP